MRPIEILRCLLFAGLTAGGPWLARELVQGGAPAAVAWAGVVVSLAACFAWIVRADVRGERAEGPGPAEGWLDGVEQSEA